MSILCVSDKRKGVQHQKAFICGERGTFILNAVFSKYNILMFGDSFLQDRLINLDGTKRKLLVIHPP